MNSNHYAAWVVFDLRLLIFVLLISLFLTLGIIALSFKGRRWHEYVTAFVSIFLGIGVLTILIFNEIATYPVFLIKDVFLFP